MATWYLSVQLCLDAFYKSIVSSGAVVFDDYGYWSGCRRAVDEFLAKHSIDVHLIPVDFMSHFFFKPLGVRFTPVNPIKEYCAGVRILWIIYLDQLWKSDPITSRWDHRRNSWFHCYGSILKMPWLPTLSPLHLTP